MTNSHIDLARFDEKRAKNLAGAIERYLDRESLSLGHAKALDLVGTLTGNADWRSLKAALAAARAGRPQRLTDDEFEARFKPMKNHLNRHPPGNGCGFETFGPELELVREMAQKHPGRVWTVVEGESNTSWLVSGYHVVNRVYYVLTNVPVADGEDFEVAHGHDDSDNLYRIRVLDSRGDDSAFDEKVYAASAQDAREKLTCEIDDESEQILEAGGKVLVMVEQVDE